MRSAQLLLRGIDQRAGPAVILFGNHQAARDRADAAFDEAGMVIEDKAVDASIAEPGLSPGQADDVVGAQQLLHPSPIDLPPASAAHRHLALAAAVEFIHTATLLHDDVVDASDLRRGRDTANAVWGNKPAVLVGDFLFARSFELMVEDGSLRILEILAHASAVIAEGEVGQLVTANGTKPTEAAYLAIIEAKTAALFAAASRLGAVLAERPPAEEEALERFGRNLGMAYQLIDDMLDFSARQSELGKSVGDDFRDRKITLPIVIAFAPGDPHER